MSRKKVKLQYILNQSSRRATFNKRKTSLQKKVNEISTLCGIEGCVIIYGENSVQPDVWPPGVGTLNVIHRYHSLSELERNKRSVDLEGFLRQCIDKSQEQLRKLVLENKKKRFMIFTDKALINLHNAVPVNMNDLNGMNDEINDLREFIDGNIKEVTKKLNSMDAEAEENAGNGIEAMTGIEQQGFIGNVGNGVGMQADVHGLDTNMGYNYFPWDNSMLAYHDYNMDRDGL
ncbi:agamous-like MADS-box protein AGL80 [Vicia villosa]|uniref:agamous-like MADS-box protein AGL80 n=1 Tax=Vicia villosa TaxID=3911 RepID=UPI00273A8D3C|nr:agamous-like MADS-box protein AGL80 [Vicia villosa]